MHQTILSPFIDSVKQHNFTVYGVHVWQDGSSCQHFWRSDDKVPLYSGSKTFTALALGICLDKQLLHLDDTLLSFFPEMTAIASHGTESIRLRHLLQMSAGKQNFWFGGDQNRYCDWAELFMQDPQVVQPGTTFFYSNACTYMLGRVIAKVTGHSLRDFLLPQLFDPLAIFNPQWHSCPSGHSMAATGLYLSLEEFSKLGQLLLAQGSWHGQRLVSKQFIQQMQQDIVSTANMQFLDEETAQGYGYQVWRCSYPSSYRADGKYGQYCVVVPDKNVCVTVTAHQENRQYDLLRSIFTDIVDRL